MALKGNLFIDFETLDKRESSVILTMGLTYLPDDYNGPTDVEASFEELFKKHSAEYKFNVKEQISLGMTTSKKVVAWWNEQGESAKRCLVASPEDLSIKDIFKHIEHFLWQFRVSLKEVRIWDRNNFDVSKLQHIWEVTLGNEELSPPWKYTEVFEIASVLKFNAGDRYGGINPYDFSHPSFIYHNAACDSALDAVRLLQLFKSEVVESPPTSVYELRA